RLITAGHCVRDSGSPNSWSQNGFAVGGGYRYTYGSGGDYGIITVDDSTFWASRGWVYVRQSAAVNGSPGTTENPQYPINGESQYSSTASTYLCHTGQTIGTRCGPKSGSNVTAGYPDATVSGLARFDAPVCRGDSGGPVYVQNAAYGVVSGGQTNATTPDCFTTTLFQGIGAIKSAYNLTLLHN
ncbi:MAG: trypsin-like serine protease, partial [Frankiales bacterium]|nr:trypsin-like serine protease [Frankiales bacterium]